MHESTALRSQGTQLQAIHSSQQMYDSFGCLREYAKEATNCYHMQHKQLASHYTYDVYGKATAYCFLV